MNNNNNYIFYLLCFVFGFGIGVMLLDNIYYNHNEVIRNNVLTFNQMCSKNTIYVESKGELVLKNDIINGEHTLYRINQNNNNLDFVLSFQYNCNEEK